MPDDHKKGRLPRCLCAARRGAVGLISALLLHAGAVYAQEAPIPAPRFEIARFDVTGNTLLPADVVERAVAPFTGKNKDFADIQRALETLELAYRERGYGTVQVSLPEQDITAGVIRFRVIEPRIGKVAVEGNRYFTAENVRRGMPSIKEGESPNSQRIARNLQLVNEHPAKQTTVLLKSGKAENEVDVTLKVDDDKPWKAVASLDNTGTSQTGYLRLGVGFQHSNLFDRDHVLTAQYITSPTRVNSVTIVGLGYRIPFYARNSSLDLIAGYSDVDSGVVQELFTVSGSGTVLGARWNYYLPKWGEVEHKLGLGLDYKAFQSKAIAAGQNLLGDVTVHPVSVTYGGVLRTANGEFGYHLAALQNIPGGNDGTDRDLKNVPRPDARAAYRIYRYGVNYVRLLPAEWQLRIGFGGQETGDALVPGEQFGIGGPDTVRGFLPREVANDRGYNGTVEVFTPDLASRFGFKEWRGRLVGFYDWGTTSRNSIRAGETSGESIASAGFGLRLARGKNFSVRIDVAQILNAGGAREKNDQRVNAAFAFVY